jgi:hypothetical protein
MTSGTGRDRTAGTGGTAQRGQAGQDSGDRKEDRMIGTGQHGQVILNRTAKAENLVNKIKTVSIKKFSQTFSQNVGKMNLSTKLLMLFDRSLSYTLNR